MPAVFFEQGRRIVRQTRPASWNERRCPICRTPLFIGEVMCPDCAEPEDHDD